eukprot:g1257.t1
MASFRNAEDIFGEDADSNDDDGSSGEDWDVQVDQPQDGKGQVETPATPPSPAPAAESGPTRLSSDADPTDLGATAITAVHASRGDPEDDEGESKGDAAASHASAAGSGPRKTVPMTDPREDLRKIYDALGGEEWAKEKRWNLDGPLCDCKGVTLDERERVVGINLVGIDGVQGDLSKVQWPAALQKLDLRYCSKIEGDLSKVQWPAALKYLNLQRCPKIEGASLA